ncbi:hypothetical protein, partial [Caldibacillus debilis]|uniref:hypothetical protein n=1 Tax=Caldibacillus debilis TaxID=301148 RepID=UPI0023F2DD9B
MKDPSAGASTKKVQGKRHNRRPFDAALPDKGRYAPAAIFSSWSAPSFSPKPEGDDGPSAGQPLPSDIPGKACSFKRVTFTLRTILGMYKKWVPDECLKPMLPTACTAGRRLQEAFPSIEKG